MRLGDGPFETDPTCIDQILFDSRKDIWTLEHEEGSAGAALLTSYFRDGTRVAALPVSPVPMTRAIAGTIFANHGSAAGLDGRPYEIYHHGVAFTTCLVGQAFHAAALGRTSCVEVLGPNGDLSV